MDCESMIVVKRSVLRTVQIFVATWRDSGAGEFGLKSVKGTILNERIPMSSSLSMLARALCSQWRSMFFVTCSICVATISSVFQPSSGEDSINNGRILAVTPASEGTAGNCRDPIMTLRASVKADWLHGPGPSYGNVGRTGPVDVVSESCLFGVVLHDEGSKARKEPEANVASMMVIKWDERTYGCNSAINTHAWMRKHTESGKALMRSEKT